jgi:hypothetical protein
MATITVSAVYHHALERFASSVMIDDRACDFHDPLCKKYDRLVQECSDDPAAVAALIDENITEVCNSAMRTYNWGLALRCLRADVHFAIGDVRYRDVFSLAILCNDIEGAKAAAEAYFASGDGEEEDVPTMLIYACIAARMTDGDNRFPAALLQRLADAVPDGCVIKVPAPTGDDENPHFWQITESSGSVFDVFNVFAYLHDEDKQEFTNHIHRLLTQASEVPLLTFVARELHDRQRIDHLPDWAEERAPPGELTKAAR